MDIEAIVQKHASLADGMRYWDAELLLRAALTELSAAHSIELRAYEATVANLEERVPDGWKGWRDISVHGYPKSAQEVLFVRDGRTVTGAFIGGIFWHNNEKCAAALWMPLPSPLTFDELRALLAAAPAKEGSDDNRST